MIIPMIPFLNRPACRAARAVSRAEVASPGGTRRTGDPYIGMIHQNKHVKYMFNYTYLL